MRSKKIIATIGPASKKLSTLRQMAEAGMAVARLNFSHGTRKTHLERIRLIRTLNRRYGLQIKILQDLEGYRLRIGTFPGNRPIELKVGQKVILGEDNRRSRGKVIPLSYHGCLTDIRPKQQIFLDDGNIVLCVLSSHKTHLRVQVEIPGVLYQHKGVNIPGLRMTIKGLTAKDQKDLEFGLDQGVDWIAQSFVRSRDDIRIIKEQVRKKKASTKIVAKIENDQGIRNLDSILKESDGIMVARGDLGVSVPIYQVPMIQKKIIHTCNHKRKFVITATHMLESMIRNRMPTRAEVTDVANAILDGSDYLMLSGETAIGKYPVESIRMMKGIIRYTLSVKP